MDLQDKTYVHNDTEVKLTGRTAERELKPLKRATKVNVVTLYEITPADSENGSWKKWVRMIDLYQIKAK